MTDKLITFDATGSKIGIIVDKKGQPQTDRVYNEEGISPTVTTPSGGRHIPMVKCEQKNPTETKSNCLVRTRSDQKYRKGDISPVLRQSDKQEIRIMEETKIEFIGSVGDTRKGMDNQRNLSRAYSQPKRVNSPEGLSPTISAQESQGRYNILTKTRIRRLTPRECARLQGFPDSFRFPVSDTQTYKQMGNAVTVTVVEAIVRNMEEYVRCEEQ